MVAYGYELRAFLKEALQEKLEDRFDYCFEPDWDGTSPKEKEEELPPAPASGGGSCSILVHSEVKKEEVPVPVKVRFISFNPFSYSPICTLTLSRFTQ